MATRRRRASAADGGTTFPSAAALRSAAAVSHNLNGQKLGRKGRDTRERILAATAELLADPEEEPISLSAVARKASLGMTSIYNYFGDLTELLVAVLEPVMATREEAYMAMLRERWPDAELGERCAEFLRGYYDFWKSHSRLLHLRNLMADNRDDRMLRHRVNASMPVISLLVEQMDGDVSAFESPATAMATVLMTGLERTITVATDRKFKQIFGPGGTHEADYYLVPEARLMELAIRDTRQQMAARQACS